MLKTDPTFEVYVNGELFASGSRFRLTGKEEIGLYPSMFGLQAWNLSESDLYCLMNANELSVMRGDSCLAYGRISDVFQRTVPEGTLTCVAFSPGLGLWEAPVSLFVEAGVSVSETVRRILEASGTGIRLLSFPGSNPVVSRGQAFFGRAAECITEALSRCTKSGDGAGAHWRLRPTVSRCYLVPAGLCIIPTDPLPATLHLRESDLADIPSYADSRTKLVLHTDVIGFQPGEEMDLEYKGRLIRGLILERMVEADTKVGPWNTQLLIELHL